MTLPIDDATPGAPALPERIRPGAGWVPTSSLRRLLVMFAVASLGWSLPNTAAATLAQALIADDSPERKVALFAVLSTIGAVFAVVFNIAGGALSDRTLSRFGRRTPWILGGAVLGVPGLVLAALASPFWLVVLGYALFQGGMNASIAGLNAVTPDRVPREKLGLVSAASGLGYLVGLVAGSVVAAQLIEHPTVGLLVVPWVLLLTAGLFVVATPDRSSLHIDPPRMHWRAFLPPLERDFLLAFAGRFLSLLALLLFNVYGLYVATDYLGLSVKKAGSVIAAGTLLLGLAALLSTIVAGVVSDRIGRRKGIVAGASAVMALSTIPIMIAPSVPMLLTFMTLAGAGYGAYLSVDAALMVEVLPHGKDVGKDLGFLALANTAPVVAAPGLAGAIVLAFGYRMLFVSVLVSALAGAICILRIRTVR